MKLDYEFFIAMLVLVAVLTALFLLVRFLRAVDQRFATAAGGHRILTRARFARYLLAGIAIGLAPFVAEGKVNDSSHFVLYGLAALLVLHGLYQDIRLAPFRFFIVGTALQLTIFGPLLFIGPKVAVPLVCYGAFAAFLFASGSQGGNQVQEMNERIAQARMGRSGVRLDYQD